MRAPRESEIVAQKPASHGLDSSQTTESDEVLIVDSRAGVTPSEFVERKLAALLKTGMLSVSQGGLPLVESAAYRSASRLSSGHERRFLDPPDDVEKQQHEQNAQKQSQDPARIITRAPASAIQPRGLHVMDADGKNGKKLFDSQAMTASRARLHDGHDAPVPCRPRTHAGMT